MNQIIEITEFANAALDVYARLTENQLLNRANPEEAMFIAESPKVIARALEKGCRPISFLMEKKHISGEGKDILERCPDIPVYTAEFDVLTKLTGFQLTRGMLAAMYRPKMKSLQEVCRNAGRIAVLEDVVNPTNVGAIIRSAAAMHMDGVVLTSACSNPLYRRAIRVSMGTVFQVPWTIVDSEQDTLAALKVMGFQTVAMALCDNSVSIDDPVLSGIDKLAIVLGTEGEGLKEETIQACDFTAKIPMAHGVDSLNVAAASAVAFWQLHK